MKIYFSFDTNDQSLQMESENGQQRNLVGLVRLVGFTKSAHFA